ncbi:DUF502 domain-containing protein [Rhodobacter sp. NTK016B]|uniref:DUF502 domain-containing protein n=1 Tax=Rhodobacter sp. NTK016B TaxID=2759676 RepID=UPI001A8DCFDE|nr:DUF502 domain-containing protein [Rhodobacter sp. NTK016B]MBN8293833.1 DUF502 domain-containing protein [Rhodobacter sp. NTK016B]
MSPNPRPPRRGIFAWLRTSFLTGLVVVAPAALTIWLITGFVEFVDSRVVPLIPLRYLPEQLATLEIPGIGVVIALLFVLIVGWVAKGFIGRSLISWAEDIVARMPVIRSIYNAIKQIAETIFSQSNNSFSRACLVEYPRPGLWAVAFVSTETRGEVATKIGGEGLISVFLPTTPNPTSGFLLFVPEADVRMLDMSVEDAAKLIISAGLVAPDPDRPGQVTNRRRRA